MTTLKELDIGSGVSTFATNWAFIGEANTPSWENTNTGHILFVELDENDTCHLKLNHKSQKEPFWTIAEVEFAAELIPMVEWILSAPNDDLWNREVASLLLDEFWTDDETSVTP